MTICRSGTGTRLVRAVTVAGAIAVAAIAGLPGCASIRNAEALETGRMLVAAGFARRFADTQEKRDHLASLTQRKLVTHPLNGDKRYVYADATSCRCLYVGDETDYQRYIQLAIAQQTTELQHDAMGMNEDAPMNWSLWRDPQADW